MKAFKHMTAFVLALVMAAALAVTAYAASVTVKYRVYVYSDEITFRQYDYSQSTTPSITNLTISATKGVSLCHKESTFPNPHNTWRHIYYLLCHGAYTGKPRSDDPWANGEARGH